MNTSDLILYHDIISEFEKCNFREALILHKHFIKIAQPIQDPDEKEAFEILQEKGLLDDYKTFAIDYFKSQPQFDIKDDFDSIYETYGANNTLLAEQFLDSIGNEQFIDVENRNKKGEEIVEMIETLSTSDSKLDKLSKILKIAIKRGLPVAFVLSGSAKLYYLLKYLIDNREELAKYATIIFGIISQVLSSIPPINFTLFNIQKTPAVYEIIEEKKIINVTRYKNEYRYIIQYTTPSDSKSHDVSIVTVDENGDKNTTKLKTGPGQSISEPITSNKKFKSIKVFDNGVLQDSQTGLQAQKLIEKSKPATKQQINAPKTQSTERIIPKNEPKSINRIYPKKFETINSLPKNISEPKHTLPEKVDEIVDEIVDLPSSSINVNTPTFNNRKFNIPEVNVESEPVTVTPSSRKIIPDVPEKKKEPENYYSDPNNYYLEKKPEKAIDRPEEFNTRKSKISGIHASLDEMVENTLKKLLGENVSMKIHEYKINEYNDVEQFVEFLFPNKKNNFIMEYKSNGNTGRKSFERHPADYFKKKPRFSLPKINLDDEQVQNLLSGIRRKN
jgi:hypothetical protein